MPQEKRTFRLHTVVLTALLSFLISGVGGSVLQGYRSRAKPLLIISSAGFEGGPDLVELSETLVELSRQDSWMDTFSKFESFETLRSTDLEAAVIESALEAGIDLAGSWLEKYKTGVEQLSKAELLQYPYLNHPVFSSSIHGQIWLGELGTFPISDTSEFDLVLPLYEADSKGYPFVDTGNSIVSFSEDDLYSAEMKSLNLLHAESVARGVRENLVFVAESFLVEERKSLINLNNLRKELQKALLKNARPAVTLTVHNAGRTAIAFRPYFGMAVLTGGSDEISGQYLMGPSDRPDESAESSILALLRAAEDGEDGEDVQPKPYLPNIGGKQYITVPPGETINVRLVAQRGLGNDGPQYLSSYESGLLRVKLVGVSLSGKPVWSEIHVFGEDITAEDSEEVLKHIRQRSH